jgi:hypothetical protein
MITPAKQHQDLMLDLVRGKQDLPLLLFCLLVAASGGTFGFCLSGVAMVLMFSSKLPGVKGTISEICIMAKPIWIWS